MYFVASARTEYASRLIQVIDGVRILTPLDPQPCRLLILLNISAFPGHTVSPKRTSAKRMTLRKTGTEFDSSDNILAMIVSLRHLLGGSSALFAPARASSSKTWLSVGNCSLCTRTDPALD